MKYSIRMAAAALCMALGLAHSQGQVTNTLTLNLQTMNINLTGMVGGSTNGGGATNFRLGTKDVLKSLGFPSSAKLQFASATLVDTNGTNEASQIFLVSTGNAKATTFTDVSSLFFIGTNSDLLIKGNTGNVIQTFGFGVDTNGVALTNDVGVLTSLTYLVQGFTTIQKTGGFNSAVNGPGTSQGNSTVLKGTITATPPNNKTQTITIIR